MNNNTARRKTMKDFEFRSKIGEGSYSTVYKAIDPSSRKTYAIKILSKQHIVKEKKVKYVNIEKQTLNKLGHHPGIVTLYYTFQDDSSLYFVIDFAEYGELLTLIRKLGSLNEVSTRYYMTQLIDAVKFMHSKGVIHRDLKPENILLNHDMKLMITDFGAAKIINNDNSQLHIQQQYAEEDGKNSNEKSITRNASFVGTAEYVSPELLQNNECGYESDIWALGCIMYQFIVGVPPFKGNTEYLTFEKIIALDYKFPSSLFIPEYIKHLISKVLIIDPFKRYTISDIEKHRFFQSVRWNDFNFIWKRNPPKIEPYDQQLYKNSDTTTPITCSNTVPSVNIPNDKPKLLNYHPGLAPHKKPIKSASSNKNSKNLLSDILSSNYVPSSNNFTRGSTTSVGSGAGTSTKAPNSLTHSVNNKNPHNNGLVNYSTNGNTSNPGGNTTVIATVNASDLQQSPRMMHFSSSVSSNLNNTMTMSSPVTNGSINGQTNELQNKEGSLDSGDSRDNHGVELTTANSPVLNLNHNQQVVQQAPSIPIAHDPKSSGAFNDINGNNNNAASNNPFVKAMLNNSGNSGIPKNTSTKKLQIMTDNFPSPAQQHTPLTPQRFMGNSSSEQSSSLHYFPAPQQQQQFMRQPQPSASVLSAQISASPLTGIAKSSSFSFSSNFNNSNNNSMRMSPSVHNFSYKDTSNNYNSGTQSKNNASDHGFESNNSPNTSNSMSLIGANETTLLKRSYSSNRMNTYSYSSPLEDKQNGSKNAGWKMSDQGQEVSSIEKDAHISESSYTGYRNGADIKNGNFLRLDNAGNMDDGDSAKCNDHEFSTHFNDILLSNSANDQEDSISRVNNDDSNENSSSSVSKIPSEILRHLLPSETIVKMDIVLLFDSSMSAITDSQNKKFIELRYDLADGYRFLNDVQQLKELFLNLNKKLEYFTRPELLILTSFGRILIIQSIDFNNLLEVLRCDSISCCEYITDNDDHSIIYSQELFKIFIIAKYDSVNGKLGIDFSIGDHAESWNDTIIKFNQSNMSPITNIAEVDLTSQLHSKMKLLDLEENTFSSREASTNSNYKENENEDEDSFSNDLINSYTGNEKVENSASPSLSMPKSFIKNENSSVSSPNTPRSATRQFFNEKTSSKYKTRSPTSSSLKGKGSSHRHYSSGTNRRNGSTASIGGFAAAAAAAAVVNDNGFSHH